MISPIRPNNIKLISEVKPKNYAFFAKNDVTIESLCNDGSPKVIGVLGLTACVLTGVRLYKKHKGTPIRKDIYKHPKVIWREVTRETKAQFVGLQDDFARGVKVARETASSKIKFLKP